MRVGLVSYLQAPKPPNVAENCLRECEPWAVLLKAFGHVLTQDGELQRAIIDEATEVKVTPSCAGKKEGRCALRFTCQVSIGGNEPLAEKTYSAFEPGT